LVVPSNVLAEKGIAEMGNGSQFVALAEIGL
jgi:hypothetical protein